MRLGRSRRDPHAHARGAASLEDLRHRIRRSARRHDVVDEPHMHSSQVEETTHRAFEVALALAPAESRLRRSVARTLEAFDGAPHAEIARNRLCDLERGIEAA